MKPLILPAWAALLAAGCLAIPSLAAEGQTEVPAASEPVILADKRIHESSGLARSLRHPGIFWTHNDSGGEPCLFAINLKGETVAKIRLPGAAQFDWEDLAAARDAQGGSFLYVADTGDNLRLRRTLQIYRIPEPDLPADAGHETESAAPEIWHLSYPDGRHNAECLLVHPQTCRLYIVTKEESGDCGLYTLPEPPASGKAARLEKLASLRFPPRQRQGKRPAMASMITGGAFSPDGRRVVLASYSYLYEWNLLPGDRPLAEALAKPPHVIEPPLTRQMEAVAYGEDSRSLWFTSEQLPSPLYHLRRP